MKHFHRGKLVDVNSACVMLNMALKNGHISYRKDFIPSYEHDHLMSLWTHSLPWSQDKIRIFGKWIEIPRLQCWFGDPGASYTYSGLAMKPRPWTRELEDLKAKLEAELSVQFNSVLVNLYRDGQDSNGWHSDDEAELGENPVIASVSLGAERPFQLKHKFNGEKVNMLLESGSLLVMSGELQKFWKHQIPKRPKILSPRINLTFRNIVI